MSFMSHDFLLKRSMGTQLRLRGEASCRLLLSTVAVGAFVSTLKVFEVEAAGGCNDFLRTGPTDYQVYSVRRLHRRRA